MKNKLNQVLKNTRAKKEMSLREFSEYLGISHTYLDKLEKGVSNRNGNDIAPTIETLSKIADSLDIPLVEFMWQCGYFDTDTVKVSESELLEENALELKKYISEIKAKILSAKKVTYNNIVVKEIDLIVITETLEVGVEIILRKYQNKLNI